MIEVINTILPVFLIILIGFVIGKKKKPDIQPIVDLVVYLSAPCLIFTSMAKSDISISEFGLMSVATAAFVGLMFFSAFILFKMTKSNFNGLYLPMVFGNSAFLAYPVALLAFGNYGLSRAVVFDIINSLFLYSAGIYLLNKKSGIKSAFKVPLIYGVIGGIIVNVIKLPIPSAFFKPMELIGAIAIPAALMILGFRLAEIRLTHIKTAIFASSFKIFFGFFIGLAVAFLFSIEGVDRNIILLQASMPSAVMTMVLCQKYDQDCGLVASTVFISTVISAFTIPLVIGFM